MRISRAPFMLVGLALICLVGCGDRNLPKYNAAVTTQYVSRCEHEITTHDLLGKLTPGEHLRVPMTDTIPHDANLQWAMSYDGSKIQLWPVVVQPDGSEWRVYSLTNGRGYKARPGDELSREERKTEGLATSTTTIETLTPDGQAVDRLNTLTFREERMLLVLGFGDVKTVSPNDENTTHYIEPDTSSFSNIEFYYISDNTIGAYRLKNVCNSGKTGS